MQRSRDVRLFGLSRGGEASVVRMAEIARAHAGVLADLVRFVAAGHEVDLVAGNHDVELQDPAVEAELRKHLRAAGATDRELARIRIVPWFVHRPGRVAWIEHGHVYPTRVALRFEFNLAPTDPRDGALVYNADYAADHATSARRCRSSTTARDRGVKSFWGFLHFGWGQGVRSFGRFLHRCVRPVPLRQAGAARTLHQSFGLRTTAAAAIHPRARLAQLAS